MKNIMFFSLCLFVQASGFGQVHEKFGKISLNDLQMEYYEKDSAANAVVLYDYGDFDDRDFKFTRHIRIKILKKEGLSRANWTLYTPSKSDFRGMTFNLSDEGEVIQEKLTQTSIFEEEYFEGRKRYKLFFPGVKVGSVIELKFSYLGLPYQWLFQDIIPVKYSELRIGQSPYIEFNRRPYGFISIPEIKSNHWLIRNVPAFVEEPHAAHYSNYVSKFEFEISKISFPRYYKEYASTWNDVSQTLLENRRFGGIIRSSAYLNNKAKELKNSNLTLDQKINEAYSFIKLNVKWNGNTALLGDLNFRLDDKTIVSGTSADINLALLTLLKKSGIQAWPLVLSTRGNGLLTPFFPSLNKLNYVAVCIKSGVNNIFLDATVECLTPGILPVKCLNGQGWLVDEKYGEWVDLHQKQSTQQTNYSNISIDENDEWIAKISVINKSHSYLGWKEEIADFTDERRYVKSLEEGHDDWFIEDYNRVKDDSVKRYSTEKFVINITDCVGEFGNEKTICPFVIIPYETNPFSAESRRCPIDFVSKKNLTFMSTINIPEGYVAKHIPQSEKIVMKENDMMFTYLTQENYGVIQLNVSLKQQRTVFVETEYEDIKVFYSKVLAALNQPVVLTKKI